MRGRTTAREPVARENPGRSERTAWNLPRPREPGSVHKVSGADPMPPPDGNVGGPRSRSRLPGSAPRAAMGYILPGPFRRRPMHPSQRIRSAKSVKLKGKQIVLGITGSIAAVETVKLARELIRHGADVVPVLSKDATEIVHPNALHFATGREPITRIDGSVPYIELVGT